MKKVTFKGIMGVMKQAFGGFSEDKVPKLSASLAYYTVFSLGPLMIVIIFLAGLFLGKEAIEGTVYTQMDNIVGHEAAAQMQEIIKNASLSGKGGISMVIGVITLLIGATSVFGEIQDSINSIWGLKAKPKLGFMKLLQSRLLSFGMIASLGFLLLVSLAVTAVIEGLGGRLKDVFPDVGVVVLYILNLLITLAVVTVLFAGIFKVLPDAKIKWKQVWPGAIATAILFAIGKFLITFYISKSDIGGTYGTAGSLVVLLVWIYYSSIILYFGAEFTKAYVLQYAGTIEPNHYAIVTKKVDVETGQGAIQQQPAAKANRSVPQPHAPAGPHPAMAVSASREAINREKYMPKKVKVYETRPAGLLRTIGSLLVSMIGSNDKENSGNVKKYR